MAADFLSGRQRNIKVGVSGYNDTDTVLQVTGKVGVGTTNASSNLTVYGDSNVTGVLTASQFVGNINSGFGTITTLSGSSINYTNASFGTAAFTTLLSPNAQFNTGIITTLSGDRINYTGIGTIFYIQCHCR